MTTDEHDHADRHSPPSDEGPDSKHSKRGRLIDALNRTRTKLHHVREEREAKKHSKDAQQPEFKLDDDVNDFLAAGRTSFTSSRPSIGSVTVLPSEDSSAAYASSTGSPRPSTSDSKSQVSPRRGPPIAVPRIDVSGSSRFPNARTVHPDDRLPSPESDAQSSAQSGSLLAPEYKSRSMSSSSILSKERRQRIRGLSVGFADAPPVIIGEGGDEAQAPPVEISLAKARARSASPQGRKTYPDPTPQVGGRIPIPTRGISDNGAAGFVPRPLARVQTGAVGSFVKEPRGPHDDELFTSVNNQSPIVEQQPPLPTRNQTSFQPIGRLNTGTLDLAKEFEMTLGMNSSNENSPVTRRQPQQMTELVAPKPQRAPPSYDLLEHGRAPEVDAETSTPDLDGYHRQRQQTHAPIADDTSHALHRRPMPVQSVQSVQEPSAQQSSMKSQARNTPPTIRNTPPAGPPQQQASYYPPPPQRQTTVVKKNIQKLEPIQPRSRHIEQDSDMPPKAPLQLVTEVDDGYRSFAERQKARGGTLASLPTAGSGTIRHIMTREYEQSPSNYAGSSKEATPQTATSPNTANTRFYENVRRNTPPEGMI